MANDPAVAAELAKVTNMTALLARTILASGASLSMLTGVTADSSIDVLPVGRDDSG